MSQPQSQSLSSIIERYATLTSTIKTLTTELKSLEPLILDALSTSPSIDGTTHTISLKPGNSRFTNYSNPQTILNILIDKGVLEDCIKLDRTAINALIKDGYLPETIRGYEQYAQNKPSLIIEKLNTWTEMCEE